VAADSWICAGCGGSNPGGTPFCGHCGRRAGAASDTPGPSGERRDGVSSEPPPEERRLVTALFADLSGFTALAEQLDADQLHEIIAPIVSRLAAVAERYGGFVAKFAGDALLVIFGAPVAQEDHAVRSLVVALEMRDELATLVPRLRPQGQSLQVHIGVNSGWVVAGMFGAETSEYSVLGDAVNLAQRLESVAPPGEIYVGESTAQLTRGQFELAPLGMLELKGMARPVRGWQLVGPLTISSGAPMWVGTGRFVGRELALTAAVPTLESLVGGRGGALAVIGEPGVGKSRFVDELRRRYPKVRWLDLRCVSYMTSVPYGPFVDLIRREFGVVRTESSLAAAARIAQLLEGTSLEWASPSFARLAGVSDEAIEEQVQMGPAAVRAALHQAFTDWILALTRAQPVGVLLEDVHWADASTLELAGELARLTDESAVALCLTGRPEGETVAVSILEGRSRRGETWIRLEPLSSDEVGTLLERMLGQPAPDELIRVIAERTGGNPFFVEEMVRSFLDSGVLERRETWRLRPDWKAISLPPNVEGVLAARIDRLPRPAATVLQIAAVVGRRVQVALLEALAPNGAEIDHALRHLVEQAFLEWLPPDPEQAVAFRHALTLEVAYLRQIRRRRQQLHRKVAEASERLYGAGDDVIDFLAGHLYRAEAVPQAIDYLLRAGERAKRLFANQEAIDHLTRGLELLPLLDDREAARRELELQAALASPLIAVKGHGSEEVGALCARVKELCQQIGNRRELFPILFALGGFHLMRGELQLAADAGTSLMSVAEASNDRSLVLVSSFAQGFTLYCRGDIHAARTHLQQGVDLYRPQLDASLRFEYAFDPGIGCHRALGLVLWLAGFPDAAVEQSTIALRVSEEQPHPYGRTAVLLYAAILHQYRREPTLLLSYADQAAALSGEHGFPLWSMWARILRRWAVMQHRPGTSPQEAGIRLADLIEAVDDYEQAGFTLFLPYWLGLLGEAYGQANRVGEGVACITRGLSVAERSGERVWEAELHRIRGELLLALSGDVGEAERNFRWSMAVANRQGARSLQLRAAVSLAQLLLAESRADEARQALEEAMSGFTEGNETPDLRDAQHVLAELAGKADEHPQGARQ
jgi:class 3 adenylate cyclase/tetratricopeptide (TPR) repeat protein